MCVVAAYILDILIHDFPLACSFSRAIVSANRRFPIPHASKMPDGGAPLLTFDVRLTLMPTAVRIGVGATGYRMNGMFALSFPERNAELSGK